VGGSFLSDHQILKRKHQKYIVESDTDEDDEMVDLKNEEMKAAPNQEKRKSWKLFLPLESDCLQG
jgi:hypothetical protein